ncbi:MAG: outer membrane beta-barrel protein [Gemmatimonadaceae bacterium]
MRRVLSAFVVGAALVVGASSAEAQRPFTIGLSAGASLPLSDLSDSHKVGYNAAAHLGINMPMSPVGFRLEGFYNKFAGQDLTGGSIPDLRVAGGNVNITYAFGGVGMRPYVIGGVGSYNVKADGGESRTDFGINAGVGAKFQLSGLGTFVEARLHTISGDPQLQFVPITFGIEF